MNDCTNGLDHGDRRVALKNVTAHIYSGRALVDSPVRHFERGRFGELFAACNYQWHRAAGGDVRKILFAEVSFDKMRSHLRADSRGQAEIASISNKFLTNTCDCHGWNTETISTVHHLNQVPD